METLIPHLRAGVTKDLAEPLSESLSVRSTMRMSTLPQVSLSLKVKLAEPYLKVLDDAHPQGKALYEALWKMEHASHFSLYPHRLVVSFKENAPVRDHAQVLLQILETVYGFRGFTLG